MGGQSQDGLNPPARRIVHQRCRDDRATVASKRVSPKGPSSGMRMVNYFINRAGRGLSPTRRAQLQRAKALLSQRIASLKKPKA